MATPVRVMVGMMAAINAGKFMPTASRDVVCVAVGHEVTLREEFENYYGVSVREAAEAMRASASLYKEILRIGMLVRLGFGRRASDSAAAPSGPQPVDSPSSDSTNDSEERDEMQMGHAVVDMLNGTVRIATR